MGIRKVTTRNKTSPPVVIRRRSVAVAALLLRVAFSDTGREEVLEEFLVKLILVSRSVSEFRRMSNDEPSDDGGRHKFVLNLQTIVVGRTKGRGLHVSRSSIYFANRRTRKERKPPLLP